jgi:hypothetical protein
MTATVTRITEARCTKAARLTDVLRRTGATTADLTDQVWANAAAAARVNAPSEATKQLVRILLADGDGPDDRSAA